MAWSSIDWESLIRSAPDPSAVIDADFLIVAANDAFLEVAGVGREGAIRRTILDVFPGGAVGPEAEGSPGLRASLERVLAARAPDRMPIARLDVRRPGEAGGEPEERFWEPTSHPVVDADGRVTHIIHRLRDVTELVRLRRGEAEQATGKAEAQLRESEERYRTLFNSIDGGFCVVEVIFDPGGKPVDYRFLELNPAFETHTGLRGAAGKTARELVPNLEEHWFEAYGRVALTGEPTRFVNRAEEIGGRWFDVYASRIGGPESRKVAILFSDISRRVRAEQQLGESQGRLQLAVEIAQMGTFEIDLATDAVTVNEPGRAIYGWPGPQTTFARVQAQFHPDDRDAVLQQVGAALDPDGPGAFEVEQRIIRTDGAVRWLRVRGKAQFEGEGAGRRAVRILGTYLDITERKQDEQVIRRSESKLRFLATLDAETRQLADPDEVTAVTARLLGEHLGVDRCAYAEVEEDEDHFAIAGNYTRGVRSIVGRFKLSDFGAECLRLHLAGEPFVVDDVDASPGVAPEALAAYRQTDIRAVISVPLHKGGRFAAGMAVHQRTPRRWTPEEVELVRFAVSRCWESIERTRVARSLRENEARLRAVVEQATAGIVETDLSGRFTLANHKFCETLGYAEPELLRLRMQDVTHRDDLPRNLEQLEALARGGPDFRIEKRYVRKDGSIVWVNNSVSAVRDASGRPTSVVAVVFDVTERRRVEEALRASEEALRDANRRKDEFLAMLAHELRNPLSSIGNAIQLVRRSPAQEHLEWAKEVISKQVATLSLMMDDLLDVSRITRGKVELQKQVVDVRAIVDHAVETVRPLVEGRKHSLTVSLSPATMRVEADPTRLEQVIVNLLANAAKYTEPGGRIALRAAPEGDGIAISVADSGIGIPPAAIPRMFDLFAQGDRTIARSEGGLGIGLTLVKSLVEMHGGSVSASSEGEGRGSEFTVRLPPAADGAGARPDPGPAAHRPRGRSKVLVVDDNVDSVRGLSRLLRLLGHDVKEAFDGPSAIEVAREIRPDFVLLDIGLPGMDGYEVASRLRSDGTCQGAAIIAITGYGQEEDRRRSREAGFDHHLVKPVDYDKLTTLIRGEP